MRRRNFLGSLVALAALPALALAGSERTSLPDYSWAPTARDRGRAWAIALLRLFRRREGELRREHRRKKIVAVTLPERAYLDVAAFMDVTDNRPLSINGIDLRYDKGDDRWNNKLRAFVVDLWLEPVDAFAGNSPDRQFVALEELFDLASHPRRSYIVKVKAYEGPWRLAEFPMIKFHDPRYVVNVS